MSINDVLNRGNYSRCEVIFCVHNWEILPRLGSKQDVLKWWFFFFFFPFFFFFFSFRNDMRTALATGDYQTLLEFLTTTFDSFSEMNEVFKVRFNEASELWCYVRFKVVTHCAIIISKHILFCLFFIEAKRWI